MGIKLSNFRKEQQITSVRLASSSNVSGTYDNGNNGIGATISIAASSLTIDSVACEVGNRILLTNQTNGYENGIYDVYSIDTVVVLKRSSDFQNIDQIKTGYYIPVSAGTQLGGAFFLIVEPQINVIGVDSIILVNTSSTPDVVTLQNNGLRIYDNDGSNYVTVRPGTNYTENRIFTFNTGDANRTLDISAADVTISTFVASVLNQLNLTAFQNAIGIKNGVTTPETIAGTTATVTATGLAGDDNLVVTMLDCASTTAAINKAVPSQTGNAIDVTFTSAPGADTSLAWIAISNN